MNEDSFQSAAYLTSCRVCNLSLLRVCMCTCVCVLCACVLQASWASSWLTVRTSRRTSRTPSRWWLSLCRSCLRRRTSRILREAAWETPTSGGRGRSSNGQYLHRLRSEVNLAQCQWCGYRSMSALHFSAVVLLYGNDHWVIFWICYVLNISRIKIWG